MRRIRRCFPAQFARVAIPLTPKKSEASLRPIGTLPALYRVALKCRRPALDAFEARSASPSFLPIRKLVRSIKSGAPLFALSAPRPKGFASDVFSGTLRSSTNISSPPPPLIHHAAHLGMPVALVLTTIRADRLPRFFAVGRAVSDGTLPSAGVIAGCAAATTWAKVGVVAAIDSVLAAIPRPLDCQIRVFTNDFDVTAQAPTNRQVVRALAHAAHSLVQSLEIGVAVPFSPPKATVVADSPALACHIRSALGHRGGKPCTSATIFGVDTAAGRSRCAARRSTRSARLARCYTRRARLRRISSAVRSGHVIKLLVAGLRPAATYGAEVTGVTSGALRNPRELVSHLPPQSPRPISHGCQSSARGPRWSRWLRGRRPLSSRSLARRRAWFRSAQPPLPHQRLRPYPP